jgi:hypothetical protein
LKQKLPLEKLIRKNSFEEFEANNDCRSQMQWCLALFDIFSFSLEEELQRRQRRILDCHNLMVQLWCSYSSTMACVIAFHLKHNDRKSDSTDSVFFLHEQNFIWNFRPYIIVHSFLVQLWNYFSLIFSSSSLSLFKTSACKEAHYLHVQQFWRFFD